jgi:ketosteroid isomerase-like protein
MKTLIAVLLAASAQAAPLKSEADEQAVRKTVAAYNEAMKQRSVDHLAEVVDDELLVLEGVHKNTGWTDYRDNHIGPEMAEWTELRSSTPVVSAAAVSGDLGYVVQESTLTIVMAKGETTLAAAETFVLRRRPKGPWRVVHVHFSGKKKDQPKPN